MKNIVHSFLRFWIRVTSYFFFEKMEISGMENLPLDCPVIFACNHPNAFLDSIVMTTCVKRPLYYTARGDFFKSKIASFLLRYINILPVYRREEGRELMHKNEETFAEVIGIFKLNGAVVIFSEGLSENKWELRPLRKGTARLAFDAWNSSEIGDRLKVVPVAIHYSSWLKICPKIHVEFLKNIEKIAFADITESGVFNKKFNEQLRTSLSENVIQVDKSDDVVLQNKLVGFVLKNFSNGVTQGKMILNKYLAPTGNNFKTTFKSLSQFLIKEDINYYNEREVGVIKYTFSMLAFSSAYSLNAIPYYIAKFITWKSTRGNDFHDSLFYCVLWIVYALYLIVLFSVVTIFIKPWIGISVTVITILSAAIYEAAKRNIQCFLRRDKLRAVKRMLNQLFETNNG